MLQASHEERLTTMTVKLAHAEDCMCVPCLNADLNAHIVETLGSDALLRINAGVEQDKATVEPVKTRNLKAGQRVGNGVVRTISSKQVWLINKLIAERDITNLVLLPGQTINPDEIKYMGVKGGTALIDKLFNCPEKVKSVFVAPVSVKKELQGSPRQIEWITTGINGGRSLLSEKGFTSETDIKELYQRYGYDARALIDALKNMSRKTSAKKSEATETKEELSEGIYSNGKTTYKVYVAQDGSRLFAKELIEESHTESVKVKKGSSERKDVTFTHGWEYKGMAFRFVKASEGFQRVSDDDAKRYGQISGTCCRCGRRLVDETSVSNGIGPECAKK